MDYKKKALEKFNQKKITDALFFVSLALEQNPLDKELPIYAILFDLARDREEEATALYEYYNIILSEKKENSEAEILEIIHSLDASLENFTRLFADEILENQLEEQDGIRYEDFMSLVKARGNFKETFEDIMFSTRVIISKKKDFIHFLNLLVEHNFLEMALNYLENAVKIFPTDRSFRSIFEKVERSYKS